MKLEIVFNTMPPNISLSIRRISPPSFSTGYLLTNLYQLSKSEATIFLDIFIVFEISLLQIFDVQICQGQLFEKCKEQ